MINSARSSNNPCIDRGWAWIVLMSSFFLQGITQGCAISVGVLVTEWLVIFPNSPSEIAWIASLCGGLSYFGAPIAGVLCVRFSHRSVVVSGCFLAAAGTFLSFFAANIYLLYISFGILVGIGCSFAYNPATIFVGAYFRRHQSVAMALATAGAGLGPVAFAPLLRWLISTLGWRGSMLCLSGIMLNGCVFGCLLFPVNFWEPLQTKEKAGAQGISSSFAPSMFKQPTLYIVFINKFLWNFGSFIFWTFLVDYARTLGFSAEYSAIVLSVLNGMSIASRCVLCVVMSSFPSLSPQLIYTLSTTSAGVITLVLPSCKSLPAFLTVISLYGMCFGGLCSTFGLSVIRWFGLESSTLAFGYLMMGSGIGALVGPPAAGSMYEMTQRYEEALYLAGGALTLSGLVLIPALFMDKNSKKLLVPEEQTHVIDVKSDSSQ